MIRPLPGQSIRSFVSRMLSHDDLAAGDLGRHRRRARSVHVQSAAVPTLGGTSRSVARTLNVCTPTPSAGSRPCRGEHERRRRRRCRRERAPCRASTRTSSRRSSAENSNVASVCDRRRVRAASRSSSPAAGTAGGADRPQVWRRRRRVDVAGRCRRARTSNVCGADGEDLAVRARAARSRPARRAAVEPALERDGARVVGAGEAEGRDVVVGRARAARRRSACSAGSGRLRHGARRRSGSLKHCSGLSVIGSSGPRLPWPVLPPPSMLTRPLLPSLAQMPQLPLSFAMLSLIVVADLGHEDAVALVVVRRVALDQRARSRAPVSSPT